MNVTFEITGVDATLARFQGLPDRIRQELTGTMENVVVELAQGVVQNKLSGQVLAMRSGRLARAVGGRVDVGPDVVTGTVSVSGVVYAAIQEYGGKTPPHTIIPDRAQALHFMSGSGPRFASRVQHPGSIMPERSYLRSELFDMHAQILQELQDGVLRSVQ